MLRRNRIFVPLVALALAGAVSLARAQPQQLPWEALTNRQIVHLVKSKVPTEEIIAKIKNSRCHFDTTLTILEELENQGVPAEVINAMAEAPYGPPAKPKTNVGTPQVERTEAAPASSGNPKPSSETRDSSVENSVAFAPTPAPPVFDAAATIPTTGSITDEITRGLSQRHSVLSSSALITGTPAANLAQIVLAKLCATTVFNGVPNLPYNVEVIQRSDPNAFNTMGGHVFVTSALAALLGNDVGLWAAVEGHEIAHNIYRHGYGTHLRGLELQRQRNYWRDRIALGDQSANRELLAAVEAGKLLNEKLERDAENDADKLGLIMMVEAGYHPDFAVNLLRILKVRVGEESKPGTLFSDHPGFLTRQEHIRELYPEAVARFRSLWPDAARSPGGLPPIIATLTKVSAKEDKLNKGASLRFSYSIHNARGEEIDAVFLFSLNGQAVPSVDPAFQGKNGSLAALKRFTPTSDNESSQLELLIPASALGTLQHGLRARGCLLNKNQILECSKEFAVSFRSN